MNAATDFKANGCDVVSIAPLQRRPMGGGYKHPQQRPGYIRVMAQKIWTAEELERMTPAEQDAIFDASIVRNPDDFPKEFLARVRARFEAHLAGPESPAQ
jgi:hypothetical protein